MTANVSRTPKVGQGPGVAASAALHVAIIAAAAVAWTHARDIDDTPPTEIPVEMVDIADITNIRAESREPPPKPVEEPPAEVTPMPAPAVEPPKPEPTPPPQAEEQQQDEEPPPPDEVAADEPPPPAPKPRPTPPKPAPPKPQQWDPSRIEALLDKTAPRAAPPPAAPRGTHNQRGIGQMNAATMDIQAAFLQQMRECWNFPAGAPHPEELVVEMNIRLSRDGHIVGSPELSAFTRAAMAHNTYMQAAGDAALRAIHICEPYQLPADRYAQWQELTLIFDPTKMVGR